MDYKSRFQFQGWMAPRQVSRETGMRGDGWSGASWLLLCALGLLPAFAAGQELCGIDSIFYDGYEVATSNPASASAPGAISSPGIAISITGPTLSASVSYPASGATADGPGVDVVGSYTGPTDTGITVNGVLASVDGGHFLAPAVPLQPGANTLNVVAANISGGSATATSSVTRGLATAAPVQLHVIRRVGFAPMQIEFSPSVGVLPNGATQSALAIDYDGDGVDDISNPAPGTPLTWQATQPGCMPRV